MLSASTSSATRPHSRLWISCALLALVACHGRAAFGAEPASPLHDKVDFNRQIRPLLTDNCFACHGPDDKQRKADLRLDQREDAVGADKPVVPGHSAKSELIVRVTSTDSSKRMPPPKSGKKLTPEQIDLLRRWIDQGAGWSEHWAFVRPVRPAVPAVRQALWPRNPVDSFILARLEREGLDPSSEAGREMLIRRVTFDLTGLPPTPAEIEAFVADPNPLAYERLVDRLLDSPRFGERLALDWLDAARFADTHGYHLDSGRDMTPWRDQVIAAFNRNQPFDQFTIEQLAGDLLPGANLEQRIASGFNRNHMINYEGGAIADEYHNAYIVDRVNTLGTVWLGLTVGCGQCHDHKYDPITQKEYYRLYAFFNTIPERGLDGKKGNAEPILKLPTGEEQKRLEEIGRKIADLSHRRDALAAEAARSQRDWELAVADSPILQGSYQVPKSILDILSVEPARRSAKQREELAQYHRDKVAPDWKRLGDELGRLREQKARLEEGEPSVMVMAEMAKPRETAILVRGQYDRKGEKVAPGVPAFLPPLPASDAQNRLSLARWLVNPSHPLTARVIVNRIWQLHFGTGLVKTAEDLGSQGDWPSHPELLDWLATEFVRTGWNQKALYRLLVTSATYRQTSAVSAQKIARDPENRLLARGPRFRLQAEFIRDQALAASGLLYGKLGGASVSPYQPAGLWEELSSREDSKNFSAQKFVQSHGLDLYRRTMYTFWKRTSPPPSLITFDAPDRELCTVRRGRTNTPLQALVLMNDPTYVEAARKLGERLLEENAGDEARIKLGFRLTTARVPTRGELEVLERIHARAREMFRTEPQKAAKLLEVGESPTGKKFDPIELAAWTMVAQVLLNLDEVVTRN